MKLIQKKHYWKVIPRLAEILFVLGLVGGISFRILIFLRPLGEDIVTMVWYIGIISYIIFFYFRIIIETHRKEICSNEGLFDRLKANKLNDEDSKIIFDVLQSQCRSKIRYNYMIWFGLSVLSLIAALFFV
ncbi:MAG: hypothetical protein O3B47_02180 [bacterium]|nr:hypothetical protein [bacterium]